MKRTLARIALGSVLALGLAEWVAAAWAYDERVDASDWSAARDALAKIPAGEPVVLAEQWLGPRVRMELPALADPRSVGAPDLRGHPTYWVLGLGDGRWSRALQHDLEDLPPPMVEERIELGDLSLTRYEQPRAGELVSSLLDARDLQISTVQGPCRARRSRSGPPTGPWRCQDATAEVRLAEIDYRPRHCLVLDVTDGAAATATARLQTGNILRGHIAMADFNARLRSDAPVELTLRSDGDVLGRWTVTDEQRWFPFAARVAPGVHDIAVQVQTTTGGTWDRTGYTTRPSRPVCLELRSLQEEAP